MSCTELTFSAIYDSNNQEIVVETPIVYPCTNVEIRVLDEYNQIIEDWKVLFTLIGTPTRVAYILPDGACRLELRLQQCCLRCPNGYRRDPITGQCVEIEEECPPCDGSPIPCLKPTIYGYAFYLDYKREVYIPKLDTYLPVRCAGGHRCNRATFEPRLRFDDNTTLSASNDISLDNVPTLSPSYTPPFAPVPNNPLGPGERSDSFTFTVSDPTKLSNTTNFVLACSELSNVCHTDIVMIFLVGQKCDNDEYVLIFSSCVAPGRVDNDFLGQVDCSPCDAVGPLPPGGGPGPDFPDGPGGPDSPDENGDVDDPPCAPIADSYDEECSEKTEVSNPYIKPDDLDIGYTTSELSIPKRVILTVSQNSCSDVSAQICTVRCSDPPTEPPPPVGLCCYNFSPSVSVYNLPIINFSTRVGGVPIDIDVLCYGNTRKPSFVPPNYTTIEAYFTQFIYGSWRVFPCIDGVIYDSETLNFNNKILIHTASDSTSLRIWLQSHFKFVSLNAEKTRIVKFWPYTDLVWYPFDSYEPGGCSFTPETETVYVKLIPC